MKRWCFIWIAVSFGGTAPEHPPAGARRPGHLRTHAQTADALRRLLGPEPRDAEADKRSGLRAAAEQRFGWAPNEAQATLDAVDAAAQAAAGGADEAAVEAKEPVHRPPARLLVLARAGNVTNATNETNETNETEETAAPPTVTEPEPTAFGVDDPSLTNCNPLLRARLSYLDFPKRVRDTWLNFGCHHPNVRYAEVGVFRSESKCDPCAPVGSYTIGSTYCRRAVAGDHPLGPVECSFGTPEEYQLTCNGTDFVPQLESGQFPRYPKCTCAARNLAVRIAGPDTPAGRFYASRDCFDGVNSPEGFNAPLEPS